MAYVAISRDLIQRVGVNIRKMMNAEIASTLPDLGKDYHLDASHIYNLSVWEQEHLHLLASIPKDWLAQQDAAYVNIAGPHPLDPSVKLTKPVRFSGTRSAYARPARDYWNRSAGEIHIDQLRAMPEGTPGRAECIQRFEDGCVEAEIMTRWEKIGTDVTDFLEKCKSLNEAIKLLPGIRMYVDRDDIARMEKKVQRAPRTELAADIDGDGITAAAVAARLVSSI
jgi:hypothetical protein